MVEGTTGLEGTTESSIVASYPSGLVRRSWEEWDSSSSDKSRWPRVLPRGANHRPWLPCSKRKVPSDFHAFPPRPQAAVA